MERAGHRGCLGHSRNRKEFLVAGAGGARERAAGGKVNSTRGGHIV